MDYEFKTTLVSDFKIAYRFGVEAIKDTAKRFYEEWEDDIEMVTELVLILNWSCWDYDNEGNDALSKLYGDLYYEYNNKVLNHFEGNEEALHYYFKTTD